MSLYVSSHTQSNPQINNISGIITNINSSIDYYNSINNNNYGINNGGEPRSIGDQNGSVDIAAVLVATTTALSSNDNNLPGGTSSTATPQTLDRESTMLLQFIVWGVLGSILAVLGFLGNLLSMVVLQRRQMRSSTSYYLLSLAIYDNGILLGMMIYFCLPALAPYTLGLENYASISSLTITVGYPLSLAAQMGSIYTCVGFTVERFIAVCRPLHAANTCTKSRTLRAILLIFIWSIVYNIPRFFHYKVHYLGEDDSISESLSAATDSYLKNASSLVFTPCSEEEHSQHGSAPCASGISLNSSNPAQAWSNIIQNSTHGPETKTVPMSSSRRSVIYKETEFGSDPTFQHLYLIYSQLFFMFLIPFLIILFMNIGLIKAVKGSKSMHQSMCASARKEHNLTVMLIAVIVVFLVCQFPTIIDNIWVAVVGDAKLKRKYTYMVFYIICTFMVEINAASNFLLYCFFGKKFRMMLLNILGIKRKQHHVAYRSTVSKCRTNGTRVYDVEVSVM